jgi:hypothetical protein
VDYEVESGRVVLQNHYHGGLHVINFHRLLKLHLAVARIGSMDVARWWNTETPR